MMEDNDISSKSCNFSVTKNQVRKAVTALYQFLQKQTKRAPALLDEHQIIRLQLSLKKIPSDHKKINIKLPHTLQHGNSEVCLLTGDLNHKDPEYEKTVNHYKDVFREKRIKGITEILPLRAIRTEYKAYEAKIRLSKSYDRFLADEKLMGILPKYLGKNFMWTSKQPMEVNLRAGDLKKEIEKVLSSTRCLIPGYGSSYCIDVGHTGMREDKVTENIVAACTRLSESLPGTAANIKTLYLLPASNAISLPLFASFGGEDLVKFESRKQKYISSEPEEVTTVMNGKVLVSSTGYVSVIPDRKNEDDATDKHDEDGKETKAGKKITAVKAEIVEADSSSNDTTGLNDAQEDSNESLSEGEGSENSGEDISETLNEDTLAGVELSDDDDTSDEDYDANEAESDEEISDDNEELQFESYYSDDSEDSTNEHEEADRKNFEHIQSLWEGGNDAELDSDQVSDTSISDTEENKVKVNVKKSSGKSAKETPAKQSKKMVKEVDVITKSAKKSSMKASNKARIQEADVSVKETEAVKARKKTDAKEETVKQSKETAKGLAVKQSKEMAKAPTVKPSKKKVKDTEVVQAPPAKKTKLSQGQGVSETRKDNNTNVKKSKKRKGKGRN